jgi:putative Ca2+/H+ antiporter (TMEM165/GDT1 family)
VDALLTTFIAALLAEFGDKTQLLAIALAARYRKPGAVLAGIAVAALANGLLAAWGGVLINGMITLRAISLLVAVALASAGISGLFRQKNPGDMGTTWRTGAFVTTAACFFLLEFGDKTQFLTAAFAARYDALLLAAAGASAGVVVANIPAIALAERLPKALPLRRIRLWIALSFLVAAVIVGVNALRLA